MARSDLGEPYDDASAKATIDTLTRFHSAYAIDHSVPPVPLFVGSGFTDDLFPVDETLRFTERTVREHPAVPVSVLLGDFGHQRASNKPDVRRLLLDRVHGWMDHYVRGVGAAPPVGVTAMTQTCPRDRPSEGPFHAPTAGRLADEHVRFASTVAQTVSSAGGSPAASIAVDPVTGGGDGCAQTSADRGQGTAVYDLPAATGAGTLLLGAPRVTARLRVSGAAPSTAQLQAHLWDVAPDGATQRLVARGTLRPTGGAQDVFELHATGWRFEAGHVPRLELLGQDAPFGRPSNAVFTIDVRSLSLDLPVRTAASRCAGRRRVLVHLRLRRGERLRSASVRILPRRARRAAVVGRTGVRVVLDGLPRGRQTVVIRGTTSRGRLVRDVRRYRTCNSA